MIQVTKHYCTGAGMERDHRGPRGYRELEGDEARKEN